MKHFYLLICLLCVGIITPTAMGQTQNNSSSTPKKPSITIAANGSFYQNFQNQNIPAQDLQQRFQEWFGFNADHSFIESSSKSDELGYTHVTYKHFYKNIAVEGSAIIAHFKDGKLNSLNGKLKVFKEADINVAVSQNAALEIAKSYLEVSDLIQEYPIETVLLHSAKNDNKVVTSLKLRIDSAHPFSMDNVYIDATTGEVIRKVNLLSHVDTPGTGATYYSGTQNITMDSHNDSYRLRETTRNIHTYDATNSDDLTTSGFTGSVDYTNDSTDWDIDSPTGNPALDVHWGMEMTYDFYLNELNHNSYDGNGSVIKNYVNPFMLQSGPGTDPNNAGAIGPPYNMMAYGLGDGNYMGPVVGIDVEGHEFTHLVVYSNGNGGLTYQGESGALNESFADIFGTCIEFYANENPDWFIGEGVTLASPYMRSMSDPNTAQQPDTFGGYYWIDPSLLFYDNGGVHINSGVMNFWFYLLVEGGTGTNDVGYDFNVPAIGMTAARDIAFRNLMNYLTSNASFADAYYGSLQATEDLYGNDSPEYAAVIEAWYAVGVDGTGVAWTLCDGETSLTETSGSFSDGSDAGNYLSNTTCTWLIQPQFAQEIVLTFSEFNVEQGYDFVKVYDGPNADAELIGNYSGNTIPDQITSSGGSLFVEFTSDEYIEEEGWSATYETTAMGVEESVLSNQLTVFPNPTNGNFKVSSSFDHNINAYLYDVLGKQVMNSEISKGENNIDISNLSKGIYLMKFEYEGSVEVKRIVIQ